MKNLIEGIGLTKKYGDFQLDHVDIFVPVGHVVGLVGSNGAGKTTVIKLLLGLIRPDEGEVRVFDGSLLEREWKERVGVVFDSCAFVPTMRIVDIARIGKSAYANWDDRMFGHLIGEFGLSLRKEVKDLSRGMGMKLSLAFALAHHPDVLILDEPTAGLDPLARDEVLEHLRLFMEAEGRGILMSSHITSDLEKISDYVICIDEGRVVFSEAKDDICDKAGVAHCSEEQLAAVLAGWLPFEQLRYVRRDYRIDVLVSNRFAFHEAFPDVPCDAASIEDYMLLMMKGCSR